MPWFSVAEALNGLEAFIAPDLSVTIELILFSVHHR